MTRDPPSSTTFLQKLKAIFVAPRPDSADASAVDVGMTEPVGFLNPENVAKFTKEYAMRYRGAVAKMKAREEARRQSSSNEWDAAYDRRVDAPSNRRGDNDDDTSSVLHSPSSPFGSSSD